MKRYIESTDARLYLMNGEAYIVHRDEDGKCYIEDGTVEEPKEELIEKLVGVLEVHHEVKEETKQKKK